MTPGWAQALPFQAIRTLPRRGRFRLATVRTPSRAAGPARPRPVVMRLRGGLVMELDLDEHLQRTIAADCHERPEEDVTCALLRPGDQVVDVGANIGYNSLRWAQHVVPGGRVFAFEPAPPNIGALRRNCALNPSLPVEVATVALGRAAGSLAMSSDRPGETSGSYSANNTAPGAFEVEVTTLDDWTAARDDVTALRLVKIDVEGFEPEVLAGAGRTLAAHRPHLLIEWNEGHGATGDLHGTLGQLAADHGYDQFVVRRSRVAGRGWLEAAPASPAGLPNFCNLLLSPR